MREKPRFIGPSELDEIRRHADWREVFVGLGIRRVDRPGNENDWWALSPFRPETSPSFHMNDNGFYCFSTGYNGGVIELVQAIREVNCYEAGRWLVENGLSHCSGETESRLSPAGNPAATRAAGGGGNVYVSGTEPAAANKEPRNRPIRHNLIPLLRQEHEDISRRGITPETCTYLGCGYLPEGGKSPLGGRIVFQVRGVEPGQDGELMPVILTHIGRAVTEEQAAADGKWHFYRGFAKNRELYNLDQLVLDARAAEQARATGHVLLVEGCFDVAKLVEAGIRNVGATFGAHLAADQLPRLKEVAAATGISRFRIWYDRDPAGRAGQEQAVALINNSGTLTASGFDWDISFPSPARGSVKLPPTLTDPGEFSGEQLSFLQARGLI